MKNILLVEDDAASRDSLSYLLRGLGHEVRATWSAEEAKRTLESFTPDVALLDVRLPGLPGDAFALYLNHKFPNIKIVFVSGEYRVEDPERFGRVDFISKPFDFKKLISAIESA
jgi:CheY-like chemotaxis protein